MRIRRTKEEIAQNIPLDQIAAYRAGTLVAGTVSPMPTMPDPTADKRYWKVDPRALIKTLEDAPWNLGHSAFAAQMIEYLIGDRTLEEVTRDHPEVFGKTGEAT